MRVLNLRTAAIALVAGLGLGGCAYGPYGGTGVSVGYGNGYYDPYYGGYSPYGYSPYGYSPYGYSRYGYNQPYYGWYNGYYYPGSGYYVYDRYRNPYRWTDAQRRYWEWRRRGSQQSDGGAFGRIVQNWADFNNGVQPATSTVQQQSVVGTTSRIRVRDVQPRQVERRVIQQEQAESREIRRTSRQTVRSERRASREDRRSKSDDE